jgi:hypothetical protein
MTVTLVMASAPSFEVTHAERRRRAERTRMTCFMEANLRQLSYLVSKDRDFLDWVQKRKRPASCRPFRQASYWLPIPAVFEPPVLFASALPLSPPGITLETARLTFEATLLIAVTIGRDFLAGAFLAGAFLAGAFFAAFFAGAFFAAFFAGAFFAAFLEGAAFFDALRLAGAFFAAFLLAFFAAFLAGAFFAAGFFEDFVAAFFADFLDFLAAMDSLLFKTVDVGSRTFERKFVLRGNCVARISM